MKSSSCWWCTKHSLHFIQDEKRAISVEGNAVKAIEVCQEVDQQVETPTGKCVGSSSMLTNITNINKGIVELERERERGIFY